MPVDGSSNAQENLKHLQFECGVWAVFLFRRVICLNGKCMKKSRYICNYQAKKKRVCTRKILKNMEVVINGNLTGLNCWDPYM